MDFSVEPNDFLDSMIFYICIKIILC
jgi:hypothetical protein